MCMSKSSTANRLFVADTQQQKAAAQRLRVLATGRLLEVQRVAGQRAFATFAFAVIAAIRLREWIAPDLTFTSVARS